MQDLSDAQLTRYSRHILLPQIDLVGQTTLLASRALIIGAGGLGSPVALYLASAGVGHITVCDDDTVDLSNLQRQIAHDMSRLGQNKAQSARSHMLALNPDIEVCALSCRMDQATLLSQVAQANIVLDCSDNFATRHAINRACVTARKPLVSGAALRFDGQIGVFDFRQPAMPCYHCLFPESGEDDDGPCALMGVLAPLVGVIGSMQALEALKLLLGIHSESMGRLSVYDALTGRWRMLQLQRDPACPVCGTRHLSDFGP